MGLLARFIADARADSTTTGTDMQEYETLIYPEGKTPSPVVSLALSALLPSPSESTALEDIPDFKSKHQDELSRFRQLLDAFRKSLAESDDVPQLRDRVATNSEELRLGLQDLTASMKDKGVETTIATARSLFDANS